MDYYQNHWGHLNPCLVRWATGLYSIGFPGQRTMWDFIDRYCCPSQAWFMPLDVLESLDLETSSKDFRDLALPQRPDPDCPYFSYEYNWWRVAEYGMVEPVPLEDLIAVFGPGDWYVPPEPPQPG